MTAAAGGMMIRRRWSTASSSGSLIQFVSPASRSEAGSSCGGTPVPGGVPVGSASSVMRHIPSVPLYL